jgi:4-hydroxy-tetrahydrodipicolinate reductase
VTVPEKIRVIQFGLGPIGSAIARHVLERPGLELVGAVDIDPKKVGRDLGEVLGLQNTVGVKVDGRLVDALKGRKADVALHATSSYFDHFKPQIIELLGAGLNVVSTAEELSFPWLAHAKEAEEIDAAAKRAGKAVLGTGVNPGFLMDSLPIFLTSICQQVDHLDVKREMNASRRRGPFQAKIGSGMTVQAFKEKMAQGRMGHVGLPESVGMVFDTLGKKLVRFETQVEPVVASRAVQTDFFHVPQGQVIGLKQTAQGYSPEGEFMSLTFCAYLDAPSEQDTITIKGKPDLEVVLKGTNGDIATIAIIVNSVKRVLASAPGLLTMRDIPIVSMW